MRAAGDLKHASHVLCGKNRRRVFNFLKRVLRLCFADDSAENLTKACLVRRSAETRVLPNHSELPELAEMRHEKPFRILGFLESIFLRCSGTENNRAHILTCEECLKHFIHHRRNTAEFLRRFPPDELLPTDCLHMPAVDQDADIHLSLLSECGVC